MRAAGAAGAVALLAVVFAAAVLAHLAAPASLSLGPPLVDAVWLAEAFAAALVAALAELLLLPRAGTIEGRKATGKSASRPFPHLSPRFHTEGGMSTWGGGRGGETRLKRQVEVCCESQLAR